MKKVSTSSTQMSINKLEGSLLPYGVTAEIDPVTQKIRPRKILQNARQYEPFVWRNTTYKIRVDINDYCKNFHTANIIRAILLYQGDYYTQFNEELDEIVLIDVNGKLFNHRNSIVIVDINPSEELIEKIQNFRNNHVDDPANKLYLITSEHANYIRERYEMNRSYEWFENICQSRISLWENEKFNVDTHKLIFQREWYRGKKELKRQHKKYFFPSGKAVHIGDLWQSQAGKWTGRPYYDGHFMDNFRIYDMDEPEKTLFESSNWGDLTLFVRRYMKDNSYYYHDSDHYVIIAGRIRKTQEWKPIVRYCTMSNLFIDLEHFKPIPYWKLRIMNYHDRQRRKGLPYDENKLNPHNLTKLDKLQFEEEHPELLFYSRKREDLQYIDNSTEEREEDINENKEENINNNDISNIEVL